MSADIVFGDSPALNFYGDFTAPASAGTYELRWLTCPRKPVERGKADFEFFGENGILSVDGGARSTIYELHGEIVGFDAAGIAAGEAAILALYDGQVHTLVRFGESITGVEMLKPELGGFQTGQYRYEKIVVPFREL